MTTLTAAIEESTYVITIPFVDEDSNAVTPTAATWTLSDQYGNVINSRTNVTISPLSSSVDVVLSGDDLAIGSSGASRRFTVKATYDSSLGTGLKLNAEVTFVITNLVNVT